MWYFSTKILQIAFLVDRFSNTKNLSSNHYSKPESLPTTKNTTNIRANYVWSCKKSEHLFYQFICTSSFALRNQGSSVAVTDADYYPEISLSSRLLYRQFCSIAEYILRPVWLGRKIGCLLWIWILNAYKGKGLWWQGPVVARACDDKDKWRQMPVKANACDGKALWNRRRVKAKACEGKGLL